MLMFRVSGPARLWKLELSVKERAKGVQEWRERGATLLGQESQVWGGAGELSSGTWMGTRGAVYVSDTIILFIGLRHGC